MHRNLIPLACFIVLLGPAYQVRAQDQAAPPGRSVELRGTESMPKIDGAIEDLWLSADSATGFVQRAPYEGAAPAESTVVYLLQDKENLYAAFRCHSLKAQDHRLLFPGIRQRAFLRRPDPR